MAVTGRWVEIANLHNPERSAPVRQQEISRIVHEEENRVYRINV
jgi:hypothetical protein